MVLETQPPEDPQISAPGLSFPVSLRFFHFSIAFWRRINRTLHFTFISIHSPRAVSCQSFNASGSPSEAANPSILVESTSHTRLFCLPGKQVLNCKSFKHFACQNESAY
jgi:hypothetical protein